MGFRCIKCKQDFGKDKDALSKHMAICTGIRCEAIEEAIVNTSEHITTCIATKSEIQAIADRAANCIVTKGTFGHEESEDK